MISKTLKEGLNKWGVGGEHPMLVKKIMLKIAKYETRFIFCISNVLTLGGLADP